MKKFASKVIRRRERVISTVPTFFASNSPPGFATPISSLTSLYFPRRYKISLSESATIATSKLFSTTLLDPLETRKFPSTHFLLFPTYSRSASTNSPPYLLLSSVPFSPPVLYSPRLVLRDASGFSKYLTAIRFPGFITVKTYSPSQRLSSN